MVPVSTNSIRVHTRPTVACCLGADHGVLGLTRAAAIEYAGAGIRINAVCRGAIETPMLVNAMAARRRDPRDVLQRLSLVGRFGPQLALLRTDRFLAPCLRGRADQLVLLAIGSTFGGRTSISLTAQNPSELLNRDLVGLSLFKVRRA